MRLKLNLPSTEDLPCSDNLPVDIEDQNYLPNLLLFMLISLWMERMDWYFGIDMAMYHVTHFFGSSTNENPTKGGGQRL